MNYFWSVSIKIQQENEQGTVKMVSEKYLVEAISPTDVEAIMANELSSFTYTITNVTRKKYAGVTFDTRENSFWDVTVRFAEENEKGKIKYRNELQLFEATDAADAQAKAIKENSSIDDYTITKVAINKYVDIIKK